MHDTKRNFTGKNNNMAPGRSSRKGARLAFAGFFFALVCLASVQAEGFRNITVVNVDWYFDNTYRISVEDVFLARLCPGFSLAAKLARYDTPGLFQHVVSLGPIVNLTDNFYLDALYGLGLDSDARIEHKCEANLHYENDTLDIGIGARGSYFPDTAYFFIIPSFEVKFQPTQWLALFNKIFSSWDNLNAYSGSYWGELDWIVDPSITIRTGGTISWADTFGYSLLVGINIRFNPAILLKYHFQFLVNTIDYLSAAEGKYGIQNGFFLDVKF